MKPFYYDRGNLDFYSRPCTYDKNHAIFKRILDLAIKGILKEGAQLNKEEEAKHITKELAYVF